MDVAVGIRVESTNYIYSMKNCLFALLAYFYAGNLFIVLENASVLLRARLLQRLPLSNDLIFYWRDSFPRGPAGQDSA